MKMNSCSRNRWNLSNEMILQKYNGAIYEAEADVIEIYMLKKDCFKNSLFLSYEFKNEKYSK